MWLERRKGRYYAAWRDGATIRRKALYTDKKASAAKLAVMIRREARGEEGLVDTFEAHKARPILDHVKDWLDDLAAAGRDDKYIQVCNLRLNKLAEELEWKTYGDISADQVKQWRTRNAGLSNKTKNHYFGALVSFCNWMVAGKRMALNPVENIEMLPVDGYEKRPRRAYSEEELSRLLAAVPQEYKLVYLTAVFTGLRRGELEALEWGDLKLNAPVPFIQLRAQTTKARRSDTLPLRADLAEALRTARGDAQDADKVFARVPDIELHKKWLDVADIAWTDGRNRRADFHSLRTTLCTMLNKAGVNIQTAMAVMRHTDIRLTTKTYNDVRLFDTAGAVEQLPGIPAGDQIDRAEMRRTGTDDLPEPGTDGGENLGVAQGVARVTIQGQNPTRTGTIAEATKPAKDATIMGQKHGLALIDFEDGKQPMVGVEPTTPALRKPCSAIELHRRGL